jgi:hypothetical protein
MLSYFFGLLKDKSSTEISLYASSMVVVSNAGETARFIVDCYLLGKFAGVVGSATFVVLTFPIEVTCFLGIATDIDLEGTTVFFLPYAGLAFYFAISFSRAFMRFIYYFFLNFFIW